MLENFIKLFIIYFAVIDPIGTLPIFLSITDNFNAKQRYKIAFKGVVIAFFILLFFGIFGKFILNHLNISAASFNIAGGLLLFIVAVDMVSNRRQTRKRKSIEKLEENNDDISKIAASPLGIPLLAGPAAITSLMIYIDLSNIENTLINFLAIIIVLSLTFVILALGTWLFRYVTITFTEVMSRIVGILLAAISVQIVLDGLKSLNILS